MRISIDGEAASHYSSRLHEQTVSMPDATTVREVVGNRSEVAALRVTSVLHNSAASIALHTTYIRAAVAHNAKALTETVAQLQDTDRLSATQAAQGSAIIEDIVVTDRPAPTNTPSGSGSTSTPSSVGSGSSAGTGGTPLTGSGARGRGV